MRSRRLPSLRERGLTLVELLVSIVILGFVMTLVSQAVFQVARVTRAAEDTTRGLAGRWAGGWSLQAMLTNLVFPAEETGAGLEGTSQRLSGYTTTPLDGRGLGVQGFELELRPTDTVPPGTEAWARARGSAFDTPAAQVVARFAGKIEFGYVDRAGEALAAWPGPARNARGPDPQELPSAITLREAGSGRLVKWFAFQGETTRPLPRGKPFWETS